MLLIGVVTPWEKIERPHLIRHLYPYSLKNGSPAIADDIVRTVLVIGQSQTETAKAILRWGLGSQD